MRKTLRNLIYLLLLLPFSTVCYAELVKIPGHIPSNNSMKLPQRGETMNNIRVKFGNPINEHFPVGNPPITQWEYNGFNVFFEYQHVIHAINLKTLIMPTSN